MSAWDNFFVAQLGASAALTGLLFVGISINMSKILAFPTLPGRALEAFSLLVSVLFVSSFMLVPNLPDQLVGAGILAIGAAMVWIETRILRQTVPLAGRQYRRSRSVEAGLIETGTALYAASGVVWLLWGAEGTYLLVPAFLIIYGVALLDAWVLLVEINR